MADKNGLVGNRMAILGAALYLAEWIAIIGASPPGPFGPREDSATVVSRYADHAHGAAASAAFFSVVLLGRIIFIIGLKTSMRHRQREAGLLDVAVAAMSVSVVLEIASYAVAAAAARVAGDDGTAVLIIALDRVAFWLNSMIFGPVAVCLLAAGLAMLRSRLFPRWMSWLALGSGALGVVGALLFGAADQSWAVAVIDTTTSIAVIGMWIWMLAVGVLLLRLLRRGHGQA